MIASATLKKYWNDPVNRFLTKAVLLYGIWYLIYQDWLHRSGQIDLAVIRSLEGAATWILKVAGYKLLDESAIDNVRTIGIDGTHGLWIGDPCNGITLFSLFVGFLLVFPGPWKHKLWFIPIGMLAIHVLNILRVVALTLIVYYFPDPAVLDFNHTYTFTLLVYAFVFGLWYWWVVGFSGVRKKPLPQ